MARKHNKNLEGQEDFLPEEPGNLPEAPAEAPAEVPVQEPVAVREIPAAPVKAPVKAPEVPARAAVQAPVAPVRKKRVRIRKKTTKHLSVAVLCTNPVTRRFI